MKCHPLQHSALLPHRTNVVREGCDIRLPQFRADSVDQQNTFTVIVLMLKNDSSRSISRAVQTQQEKPK